MQFELMTPMEQAAGMGALALLIIAITYMADRICVWSCLFMSRRARGKREDTCCPAPPRKTDG